MILWLPDYLHTVVFGNSIQNSLQSGGMYLCEYLHSCCLKLENRQC